MKKWMILIGTVIAVFITCFILIFMTAKQQINSDLQKAEAAAETEGLNVQNSYHYHGSEVYYVVEGTLEGKDQLFFFPENQEIEPVMIDADSGISESQVLEMLNDDDQPHKILSSKIGMEPVGPVWEIVYKDEDELLNYYYVKFDSGDWWRTIRNL
ncbi:hypothetical protein [Jeotgalibacillus salarius]|uniref:DUF5590 domain-containing protein n=1 Tax=Jeotgalibacillus salarius TaxID=546023 RepID=A0A4Y8LJF4_9BACL|nr:hypothetical protein [Jeotgalibacillus salarius]TFE03058.1 hypothetical protein E2626_04395 [Jeotgalibacillus salarius]